MERIVEAEHGGGSVARQCHREGIPRDVVGRGAQIGVFARKIEIVFDRGESHVLIVADRHGVQRRFHMHKRPPHQGARAAPFDKLRVTTTTGP